MYTSHFGIIFCLIAVVYPITLHAKGVGTMVCYRLYTIFELSQQFHCCCFLASSLPSTTYRDTHTHTYCWASDCNLQPYEQLCALNKSSSEVVHSLRQFSDSLLLRPKRADSGHRLATSVSSTPRSRGSAFTRSATPCGREGDSLRRPLRRTLRVLTDTRRKRSTTVNGVSAPEQAFEELRNVAWSDPTGNRSICHGLDIWMRGGNAATAPP